MDMLTRLSSDNGVSKEQLLTQLARRYIPAKTKVSALSPLTAPLNSLLNIEDSALLQQTIAPEALRATGIFEPGVVEKLLKQGDGETPRELLLVFTTQLLIQLFGMEV